MSIIVKKLEEGLLQSNSFIIVSDGEAALIDAGVQTFSVLQELEELKANLKYIILTHCHVDHIWFADEIRRQFPGVKLCVHLLDSEALTNSKGNLSFMLGDSIVINPADLILNGGEKLQIGKGFLEIIHTPGHSEGGICIAVEGHIFTGDTLFKGAWGRTDFPGGNNGKLLNSIQGILGRFDGNTIIHSGHGLETTVSDEIGNNLYKHFLGHN